jgi:hypothetical protein
MPLPIPKPISTARKPDLHYMSFKEVLTQLFTDEHEPFLQNRRRNNNIMGEEVTIGAKESRSMHSNRNKIKQGKYIR